MTRPSPALAAALLLAVAAPAAAQTFAEPDVRAEITSMLDGILTQNTGARATVTNAWGYENANHDLLFCGRYAGVAGISNFVIFMDGFDDDIVEPDVSPAQMQNVGCNEPGYKVLAGGGRPTPAGLSLTAPPRSYSTFRPLVVPADRANERDCILGRELAHRYVVLGEREVLQREPRGAFNDLTRLRNLCFNAAAQQIYAGRLNGIQQASNATAAMQRAQDYLLSGGY